MSSGLRRDSECHSIDGILSVFCSAVKEVEGQKIFKKLALLGRKKLPDIFGSHDSAWQPFQRGSRICDSQVGSCLQFLSMRAFSHVEGILPTNYSCAYLNDFIDIANCYLHSLQPGLAACSDSLFFYSYYCWCPDFGNIDFFPFS